MKIYHYVSILLIGIASIIGLTAFDKEEPELTRDTDFNFDWEFVLTEKNFNNPNTIARNKWESVNLPHDWSIGLGVDTVKGNGATAYYLGGMGIYKKKFTVDTNDTYQTTYLYFDGVYNRSQVWLNGKKLGEHPYGYSPFYFDITDDLKKGENEVVVKIDRSRYIDSRWYTGSGIYRNVKLIRTNNLHIPVWGTYLTTPEVSKEKATVKLNVKVKNKHGKDKRFKLMTSILDAKGKEVAKKEQKYKVDANAEGSYDFNLVVENPSLWDIDNPVQYKAVTTIITGGKVVDKYETPFGIRTILFDKDKGFFLNGKNRLIKGVCIHHDGGLVGSAVPKEVWRRRLQILKDGGCNAIRMAHNPSSEELLELCDEMGLLVQEEFFDEWDYPKDKRWNQQERHDDHISRGSAEYFQEWAEKDLKLTMLRDRNHPSIFQWSIGNEIEWTYPRYAHSSGFFNMNWEGNYFWSKSPLSPKEIKKRYEESEEGEYVLANTAKKLSTWTKEMDTTRPVTANCILPSVSHESGYADALDVVGYSYRRVLYDYGHKNYDKPVMGTENLAQWHEWKAIQERPFISGTFFWTGIEYLGEAAHRKKSNEYKRGLKCGMIDLAGFPKASYQMMKTLWKEDEAHIHLVSQTLDKSLYKVDEATGQLLEKKKDGWKRALWSWHAVNEFWNYKEGDLTVIEAYSNCEELELFLNGQSLGKKKLSEFEDRIFKWAVPYKSGELLAVGKLNGKTIKKSLYSAGKATSIKLTVDKTTLNADGYDVAHIVAQLVDKDGHPVRHLDQSITFDVKGDIEVLGVDNGDSSSLHHFKSNTVTTANGRALLIVQSLRKKADVKIEANGKAKVGSNQIKLTVK